MSSLIQIGRNWLAPDDFLATVGAALARWLDGDDSEAAILSGDFVQAKHIPVHVKWGWSIFPPGFDADPLLEVGRRNPAHREKMNLL